METDKQIISFPTNKYIFRDNDLIEIPKLENAPIEVVDEWDTPGVCKDQSKICWIGQELHRSVF